MGVVLLLEDLFFLITFHNVFSFGAIDTFVAVDVTFFQMVGLSFGHKSHFLQKKKKSNYNTSFSNQMFKGNQCCGFILFVIRLPKD